MTDIERPILICDEDATVLLANLDAAKLLGRPIETIVGKNGRDWTHRSDIETALQLFAASVQSGNPMRIVRRVIHPDMSVRVVARLNLLPFMHKGRRLMMCVNDRIRQPELLVRKVEAAEYIADLLAQLQKMAVTSGLNHLAESIGEAADLAGRMNSWLDCQQDNFPPPH